VLAVVSEIVKRYINYSRSAVLMNKRENREMNGRQEQTDLINCGFTHNRCELHWSCVL